MIRFPSKQFRYIYWLLFVVWLLISTHVAYMYVSFSSDSKAGKGGTFIEASVGNINYLPYATARDEDKFYQSLLFNGCVYPTFSGTSISYREELCSVTTSDYKTFIVTPHAGKTRADGEPFTLNDIYFTYNTLLKDNYRNIPSLDPFKSINVLADETGTLEVIFPQASVDNMIYFTNFILPAHLLANKPLEHYIATFYTQPIGTNCGRLQPSSNDPTSIVFDLSECTETLLKYYQVKQFQDSESLASYLQKKNQPIDLVFLDSDVMGYQKNYVVLNKFLTVFFNTQQARVPVGLRKELGSWLHHQLNWSEADPLFLYKDAFLFDAIPTGNPLTPARMQEFLGSAPTPLPTPAPAPLPQPEVTSGDLLTGDSSTGEQIDSLPLPENTEGLRALPTTLSWSADKDLIEQEYLITTPIVDKQTITFQFAKTYEKVSVTFNDGVEYFPESYNPETQSTLYNFNVALRNITQGRNVYTIKGYENGINTDTFTLIVHYLSKPTTPGIEATSTTSKTFRKLNVIYFEDPTTDRVAEYIKTALAQDSLQEYFTFESFDDSDTFAGKIESGDYDLVIREINMGLRKDISNMFTSDVPNINPSRYTNEQLASAINSYFLADISQRDEIKSRIDALRGADVPLVILGKALDTISIRSKLQFPYPFRLYVLGWRKDFINSLNLFDHLSINRDRLFDPTNFKAFLQKEE